MATLKCNRLRVYSGSSTKTLWSLLLLTALAVSPARPAFAQDAGHSSGWVVISVPEYRALRVKAYPAERQPEPPPVDATLTRVEYDLRADSDLASGHATLTVDVLKNGWVRVPIPAGLFVREARLDGKPLSLAPPAPGQGGTKLSALLAQPGRSVISLEIALPVVSSAGEERLSLPSTPSGVTKVTLEVSRPGVDLSFSGGLFADSTSLPDGGAKWVMYATGAEPMTFVWRRKVENYHASLPLRMRGTLTQFVGLGEDSTSLKTDVNLEITQGAAKEARIEIPNNVTINQVQGALVADWETKPGELRITFLEPVEQAASFVITGEAAMPHEGPIDVPMLRLTGTERDSGGLAVDVLGAGEIKEGSVKSQGLDRVDASDLGSLVASHQSPALLAFRMRPGDTKTQRSLHIDVARYAQQAVLMANIEEARYRVLLTRDGKSLVEARYAVRNNQRNFVKVALPPGATLWSASLAGNPVRPGSAPDGSLLLPLAKVRAGDDTPEFALEFVYLLPGASWAEKGRAGLALPGLDLPISRTGLQIYYPPNFRLSAESGRFHTEEFSLPASPILVAYTTEPPPNTPIGSSSSVASDGPTSLASGSAMDAMKDGNERDAKERADKQLVDKYHAAESGSHAAGILPVRVDFPAYGPSLYLVSELTGENQAPSWEFSYQQEKKGGGK
ncbi:MAG TPA: hypothetical protein VL128_09265 [Candidatus Eisenbacteria bacterium]|nr:hypothetical protein [Candidatus Eisenbacteria bacterium]